MGLLWMASFDGSGITTPAEIASVDSQICCHFIGGPWDGLKLELPSKSVEIILRNPSPYWPSENVYRRDRDGDIISMETLLTATYRLVKNSSIIAENERLWRIAKEQEAIANKLIGEVQREKQRWRDRNKRRAKKRASKPIDK